MMAQTQVGGLKGKHVLIAFLGFFGVIFAVNGVFLYSAISTYTGVVAQEPYRKGLQYNDRIAAGARQAELGWTETIEVNSDAVILRLTDRAGKPVSGLRIEGVLGRPSTNPHDIALSFSEIDTGRYAVDVGAIEPGSWMVNIEAAWPRSESREPVYRARKRLWLKS